MKNMKKLLLICSALAMLFQSQRAQAQVSNDNTINMQAVLVAGWGKISAETAGGGSNPTFIGKIANDTDDTGTLLLNTAYSTSHLTILNSGVAKIANPATLIDEWGPDYNSSMGVIIGSTSNRFDFSVMSWETDFYREDGQARYQLINCGADYCTDDNPGSDYSIRTPKSYASSSEWYPEERTINNGSKYEMKLAWRYEKGNSGYDALDFGDLSNVSGQRTHVNSNKQPSGASPSLFYSDYWGTTFPGTQSFTAGKDVTYEFEISNAKTVVITTDFAETDFDTHIHLISLAEDATTYSYIVGDDDGGSGTKSIITRDLCPGDYAVVVEGHYSSSQGDFKIGIQASNRLPNPGTVTASGGSLISSKTICPNTAIGILYGWVAGTAVCGGSLNYQWQKSTNNGGWTNISGATSTSLSSTGNIGGSPSVRFRRAVSEGASGNTAYSNIITVTPYVVSATSAGGITGGGNIPYFQEVVSTVSSTATGAGSPGISYSWYQSIDNGLTWKSASPNQVTTNFNVPSVSNMGLTGPEEINLTSIQYKRRTTSTCNDAVFVETTPETFNVIQANGRIQGTVFDRNGASPGPNGIKVYALRTTTVEGGIVDKLDSSITTNGGQFNIPNLYYGRKDIGSTDQATYVVTPYKELHGFDPENQTVVLDKDNFDRTLTFKDTTGYLIKGFVTQECPDCDGATLAENTDFLKSVSLKIDGTALGDSTGITGQYALIREDVGTYAIKPEFETHQFDPVQQSVSVGTNSVIVEGINFRDTTTHVISGNVVLDTTGCPQTELGEVEITFTKILDPGKGITRIKRTITTNSQGYYSVRLPAGKYRAEVQNINNVPSGKGLVAGEMLSFLNAYPDSIRVRDITNKDTTMSFVYYEAPQIRVIGLNPPPCDSTTNPWEEYTIFEQGVPKPFTVAIYRGDPLKNCLALSDTLKMATNIQVEAGDEKIDTLVQNGTISLSLIGGEPNTVPPDYLKTLSFAFKDRWGRSATNVVLKPIVTGIRASTGSFLTVSPEIPFLILRDPPGDLSSSFLESNSTIETASSYEFGDATEIGTWVEAKVGAKFEAGIGFSTESEFYGSLGGSLSATKSNKNAKEVIETISNTTKFSTDDGTSSGIVGESGDVFVGAALNLKYSKVLEVIYDADSCLFKTKKSFMMADSGFATTYVYTESHIKNTLLPILRDARNLEPNQAKKDSASNQIKVWEQTLQRNQDLKKASIFDKNYSFDGAAGPIEESITTSSSASINIEFDLELDANLAIELGMEVGGSGLKGGSNVRMRKTIGNSKTNTALVSTTAGFKLDDDDAGDYFSINVKKDPVYNTPVFELAAGTSSCPLEVGTMPRDRMEFFVPNPILENVPADQKATFQIKLANSSESEEDRTYYVSYVQGSADGTIVDIGGNPSAIPVPFINMPYNTTNTLFAGVLKQPSSNVFTYNDIRFRVFDGCNGPSSNVFDIVKEVSVFANFVNPCSPINLAFPVDNFEINKNDITIKFDQYVYAQAFDFIAFQWALKGSNIWNTAVEYTKAEIDNSTAGHQRSLNIAALPEGEFKFRARLKCGVNTVYSKTNRGVIDRKGPQLFGDFEPVDKNYVLGDVISATFSEDLKCQNFEQTDFTLKKASDNTDIPAVLGCYQNQVIISPNSSLIPLVGEKLLVTLTGVTDKYGNENTETFNWYFGVGTTPVSASPYTVSVAASSNQIAENSPDSVAVTFTVSQAKNYDNVIYYNLGGSAVLEGDYSSDSANLTLGYQGSVTIDSNEVSKTIYIKPMNDPDVEANEVIQIQLSPTGEYGLAANNAETITILNDDVLATDCDNNGIPFTLSNNNGGGTGIIPGTYHKLILNSDGMVDAPTTVVFKGERSITLNPGFSIESGSVFAAILEDCPEGNEISGDIINNVEVAEAPKSSAVVSFEEYSVQELNEDGKIVLQFAGASEFGITAMLYDHTTHPVLDSGVLTIEKGMGEETVTIDTTNLVAGVYHLKMEREGRTLFHSFVIQNSL